MQGSVKFYNDQKGFGFIVPEDGSQDLFFHITQCDESYEMPQEGDLVSYEIGQGRDGRPCATGVAYLGSAQEGGQEEGEYEEEYAEEEAGEEEQAEEAAEEEEEQTEE